ncbi:MAG: hypothetical protein RL479_1436, partial [Verrucomicrobiota bacterium]
TAAPRTYAAGFATAAMRLAARRGPF